MAEPPSPERPREASAGDDDAVWWTMQQVWVAWKHLIKMLTQRGWTVPLPPHSPGAAPSWDAFWSWVVAQGPGPAVAPVFAKLDLTFPASLLLPGKPKAVQARVLVHWCPYEKVGTDVLSTYVSRMEEAARERGAPGTPPPTKSLWIFIIRSPLTPPARSILECVRKGGMTQGGTEVVACEVFLLEDLLVDPTESALVPPHHLCSPAEQAAVFSAYHLTVRECPTIRATDPVARYYGALRGHLFRIVRADGDITYRVVV